MNSSLDKLVRNLPNDADSQYLHAIKVWNTFKLKNMGEYHDLYFWSNVLSLADVFENFRKTCKQYYDWTCAIILQVPVCPGMQC